MTLISIRVSDRCESQMKCNMGVQTKVALKSIGYISTTYKKKRFALEKNLICHDQTRKKSEMGHEICCQQTKKLILLKNGDTNIIPPLSPSKKKGIKIQSFNDASVCDRGEQRLDFPVVAGTNQFQSS